MKLSVLEDVATQKISVKDISDKTMQERRKLDIQKSFLTSWEEAVDKFPQETSEDNLMQFKELNFKKEIPR